MRSGVHRIGRFVLSLAFLASALLFVSSALGASGPPLRARPAPRIFGVVPATPGGAQAAHRPRPADFAATPFATGGNLTYHGGPIMRTNTTYAIYWLPPGQTMSPNYQSIINGFFQNVAAASGSTSTVYESDTQYYQGSSPQTFIQNQSTFGGSFVDSTNAIPTTGTCSSQYGSPISPFLTGCITDAQIQAEIESVLNRTGWTPGPTKLFLLFTPRNVGSCADTFSGTCAYTYYCAYHSWIGSGSSATIYANQPYAAYVPAACDAGQHPNADDADATINVASHEHNEAITDWQGNAWYDRRGYENGDKCAWNFGTALGSTGYGAYNQVIGGGSYYLQQEWSNASPHGGRRKPSARTSSYQWPKGEPWL